MNYHGDEEPNKCPQTLGQRLAHSEEMVIRLQDTHPELSLIWLKSSELLRAKIAIFGADST